MFRSLLKHDMRAIWRKWWIMLILLPGLALAAGAALHVLQANPHGPVGMIFQILSALFLVVAYIALFGSSFYAVILVYTHFYKSLYTDEGYLTFTLPVTKGQILASKTVNAFFWTSIHTLLIVGCLAIVVLMIPQGNSDMSPILDLFAELGSMITDDLWRDMGGWLIVYAVELALLVALSVLLTVALVHLCITFGSMVAKKAKMLAAIGIYYGFNVVLTTAFELIVLLGIDPFISGLFELLLPLPDQTVYLAFALMALIVCVIVATLAAVVYFITQNILERKLNLA